jgi:hypothetical protein
MARMAERCVDAGGEVKPHPVDRPVRSVRRVLFGVCPEGHHGAVSAIGWIALFLGIS